MSRTNAVLGLGMAAVAVFLADSVAARWNGIVAGGAHTRARRSERLGGRQRRAFVGARQPFALATPNRARVLHADAARHASAPTDLPLENGARRVLRAAAPQ